jgi:predicted nuclease of predicted toxin-antitoxin system
MRLLLDECVPARLRKALASHQVSTVPEEGWSGVKKREDENLTAAALKASAAMER